MLSLVASGCSLRDRMSTFDTKGPIAEMQLDLFMVTLYVTLFLFVTVGGTLLVALIRFREKAGDKTKPYPEQMHGNSVIEVGLIAVSILCLVIIAVPTLQGIWFQEVLPSDIPEEEVIEVNVKGWQWWWSFEYPDLTDSNGRPITTANELVIPKGKVVKLNLRSMDVIHSFWLPKLAGKVDLMPGRQNWMWLRADEEGHYYGQCAEYCGESHAYMLLRAEVLSEEDWQMWVAHQHEGAVVPEGATSWPKFFTALKEKSEDLNRNSVLRGARHFMTSGGCIQCHTIDGAIDANGYSRAVGLLGPDLTHVASRKSLGAGLLDNRAPGTDEIDAGIQSDNILQWIYHTDSIKPGNLMSEQVQLNIANQNLTEDNFRDIASFIQTLK